MELSCTGAADYGSIIYYSHLIPVAIILLLSVFVLIKSQFSFLAKVFSLFSLLVSLWLVGDVVTWVSTDFSLIAFFWASLDYINIVFYLFAAYFFFVLVRGKDLPVWAKLGFFALSLPAWYITVTNSSIVSFDSTWCEAWNNEFLTNYKLAIEILVLVIIIFTAIYTFIKNSDKEKRRQVVLVSIALVLFFITFSITEYIASTTGIYEVNLYSLFVLPVFLFMIIYSVTNLRIFDTRLISMQLLTYVLMILVGSQFFFLENATNQILTIITFVLSLSFGILLSRDAKREIEQRKYIETLATDLKKANDKLLELDKQKSEFVSFASHQLRSPLTAMKGYTSLLLEGEMGELSSEVKEAISRIFESSKTLTTIVDDYLNISRIELGTMKYAFETIDFKDLTESVIAELKPTIEKSKLEFTFSTDPKNPKEKFLIHADKDKFKQVIGNLIDNSMKYTPSGSIKVSITKKLKDRKLLFAVKDTGVGIPPEVMPKLFAKFVRATNANKQNIYGTGLGLYVAKEITKAQKGRIWAESEGEGKGSTFFLEIDMAV